ncbi:MAG: IS110 family transposase [Atopobiaceae bacterium]|nr:IS110 family transposase [Atopobiaceae bacterium]
MAKFSTFVGMDVHARSVTCRGVTPETGEAWSRRFDGAACGGDVAAWLLGLPGPVYCAYESGCTGFELCRQLRSAGLACDVVAVSTLPKSGKDRKRKNDRSDAASLMRELANPASDYTTVWVPPADVEAARDLARARDDSTRAAKAAKQQLLAFLLRHGVVWDERTKTGRVKKSWGADFMRWLDAVELPEPAAQAALESYRDRVDMLSRHDARLRALVAAEADKPRWKPYVDALMRLKGVDVQTAFLAAAEFGDFSRFPSGRRVSCWIGAVPTESSSGPKESRGGITKDGNSHLRRCLVEGCCSLGTRARGAKRDDPGRPVSPAVERIAAAANDRLLDRYEHLVGEGVHANKARMAVVSEMARWVWAIGLQVQSEQAA